VKIQLFGKRKTFSLDSRDPALAATEACQIYQTIAARGWDAIGNRAGRFVPATISSDRETSPDESAILDASYWRGRLIHRKHPEPSNGQNRNELSARIEHAGIRRYFPLGTNVETVAAAEAMRIHQSVIKEGWASINLRFKRELTLAFRWLDNPLAWTYTTIHSWTSGDEPATRPDRPAMPGARKLAVVEPDASVRYALAACVNAHERFECTAAYSSVPDAAREINWALPDLIMINFSLPDQSGLAALEELQELRPGLAGLFYSEFEDSDELFKATPGGSTGYLLKRTPATRLLDPILETTGPLTRELIATKIREYFQAVVAAMPSGPSALATAKLTPREHEILTLMAKGQLAKEIAEALGISIWTVHGHVKSIFEKLNVHTRTEAVVKFLQK
jgi:DNA-binding NarL/FixJ family response regulator